MSDLLMFSTFKCRRRDHGHELESVFLRDKASAILSFCEPFAVRLRAVQPIEHYVQVTKNGDNKSVVNPDVIRNDALDDGQDCTAYDSHIQEAGAASRERTELRHSQAEDRGEHNRVEEPYG